MLISDLSLGIFGVASTQAERLIEGMGPLGRYLIGKYPGGVLARAARRLANLNKIGKIWPSEPVCIVSRWIKLDGSVRRRRDFVCKDLPGVLWWDNEYWRTGNLKLEQDS